MRRLLICFMLVAVAPALAAQPASELALEQHPFKVNSALCLRGSLLLVARGALPTPIIPL
jgi:hypothetical protein